MCFGALSSSASGLIQAVTANASVDALVLRSAKSRSDGDTRLAFAYDAGPCLVEVGWRGSFQALWSWCCLLAAATATAVARRRPSRAEEATRAWPARLPAAPRRARQRRPA